MRFLAGAMLLLLCGAAGERSEPAFLMRYEGIAYHVAARETLGEAVTRHAVAQEQEPSTNCVPESLEEKPPGTTACRCYEQTQCERNTESTSCKRHCRKDLCKCCQI